jgi:hypothetical protein
MGVRWDGCGVVLSEHVCIAGVLEVGKSEGGNIMSCVSTNLK